MESRLYTTEDYKTVYKWWKDWNWDAMPEVALPETGIVVSKDGVDLAASFIYKTDSIVCWAENFISNKKAPRELRKGSVEFLIEKTVEQARDMGFNIMMSSISHKGLIDKLTNAGYQVSDTKMTNLVRVL